MEPHRASNGQSTLDHFVETDERSSAYKEDVGRIDLRKLLMGMFSASLRWNISDRTLQHFQQGLLNAFARNVPGNRRVFVLPADFVDFIYIDDAGLGAFDVPSGILDQTQDDIFDVFTHISGFGQRRRINNRKWNAEQTSQRLGQKRLSGSCRSDQQDVRLLKL